MTLQIAQILDKAARATACLALACVLYTGLGLQYWAQLASDESLCVTFFEQENKHSEKENCKLDQLQDVKFIALTTSSKEGICSIGYFQEHRSESRNVHVLQVPTPPPEC